MMHTYFMLEQKSRNKKIITNGGRVLGVTALGDTLEAAIKHAYDVTEKISWENKYLRTDIGKKGLLSPIDLVHLYRSFINLLSFIL